MNEDTVDYRNKCFLDFGVLRLSSVTVTLPEKMVDFTSLGYWCRPGGTIAAITSAPRLSN